MSTIVPQQIVTDDSSVPIALLEQLHEEYVYNKETWDTISDLREGAACMKRNAHKYCPLRSPDEDKDIYRLRLEKFTYTPLMNTAIREFVAKLCSSPVHFSEVNKQDEDFWSNFRKNNNPPYHNQTRTEAKLFNEIFSIMLYYGRVFVAIDAQKLDYVPTNALEAEGINNTPYVLLFDPRYVINWGNDWFVTKQYITKAMPLSLPVTVCRWMIWEPDRVRVYEMEVMRSAANPWLISHLQVAGEWLVNNTSLVAQVPKVGEWVHGLGRCPMVEVKLPLELWTGNSCYQKQLQHTRIESGWTEAGTIAGTIQRVFSPSDPPPEDDTRVTYQQPNYQEELAHTGNNYVLVGKDFRFVESTGSAITSLTSQLDKIEQQIKDIVSMSYASSSPGKGNLQQSGASKEVDRDMLQDAMQTYGSEVISVYNVVLSSIAKLVGKKPPSVSGLTSYQTDSLDSMAQQSTELQPVPLPPTARKIWTGKLVNMMVGSVSDNDEQQIAKEMDQMFESGLFDPATQAQDPATTDATQPTNPEQQMLQNLMDAYGLTEEEATYVIQGGKNATTSSV